MTNVSFSGVLAGSEALLLEKLNLNTPLVIITHDEGIEDVAQQLQFLNYATAASIITLPSRDNKPYELISATIANRAHRLHNLFKFHELIKNKKAGIIITSIKALAEKLPDLKLLFQDSITLTQGQIFSTETLIATLNRLGFRRVNTAIELGEFAVKGSIIDIVDQHNLGFRLDFFGNTLESIRQFSPGTQRSTERFNTVQILPAAEVIMNEKTQDTFIEAFYGRNHYRDGFICESVRSGVLFPGYENFLSHFYKHPLTSLLTYLPKDAQILLDGRNIQLYEEVYKDITNVFSARKSIKTHGAVAEQQFRPSEVEELYLAPRALEEAIQRFDIHLYSEFKVEGHAPHVEAIKNFYQYAAASGTFYLDYFADYARSSEEVNLICCFSSREADFVAATLKKIDLEPVFISNITSLQKITKGLFIAVYPLENGFKTSSINFISEQNVLGRRAHQKVKSKSRASAKIFRSFKDIDVKDLVVHKEHGIGRFEGLVTLNVVDKNRDMIMLIYRDGDKLYVPIENLELISKYSAGNDNEATLDKLGALAWQKRKAKIKERIKIQAEELLKTAALRALRQAPELGINSELYDRFVAKFRFIETEDQQKAIQDVIKDLAAAEPMDRLVCGDVGFGKTEVALRAACIVATSTPHTQVALIVPTTLLARQHYKTFSERFADLPVRVAQLSKFTARAEVAQIKQDLQDGKIDIIIGTHALLGDSVKFKQLGLIIIDEEQHFGVRQKEKLKKMKENVHILTLSATPIPRTLQMSLSGIKSLSLLTTPPEGRLPIETFVLPFDELTVRDAVLREKARGGRTFVVTPRIANIATLEPYFRDILEGTGIKIMSAHGGLSSQQLDDIMNQFYDGKFDVLISTTIIESGLDIPDANTIIIDRANMFGLSQSYQIRGRVGRSNIRAYAYFTFPRSMVLSENARKRLSVIESLDSLGAGFQIASQDMDIRGYGNLVGEEQSGHVREVGLELYQDMLSQAINELKGQQILEDVEFSPTLNLGFHLQIPDDYIEESATKLQFYRRIASLTSEEEYNELHQEMEDRFGPVPLQAELLLEVVKLKSLCKLANIERVDRRATSAVFTFRLHTPKKPEKVMEYVSTHILTTTLRPDQKVSVALDESQSEINTVISIARIIQNFI